MSFSWRLKLAAWSLQLWAGGAFSFSISGCTELRLAGLLLRAQSYNSQGSRASVQHHHVLLCKMLLEPVYTLTDIVPMFGPTISKVFILLGCNHLRAYDHVINSYRKRWHLSALAREPVLNCHWFQSLSSAVVCIFKW